MATKKYYAVKSGNETGIFETWSECEKAIKGFSGAEYKSFLTKDEAEAYLTNIDFVYDNEIYPRLKQNKTVIFVDGSYDENKKAYGAGVYILTPDGRHIELSRKGKKEILLEQRNIVGEIMAVYTAMDWCIANGVESVSIFHDYEGLSKWAKGEWRANNPITQNYQRAMQEKMDVINVEFVKVKGHSNNKYNDKVDALAKAAINNKIMTDKNGNNGYIVGSVKLSEVKNLLELLCEYHNGLKYDESDRPYSKEWKITMQGDTLSVSLYNGQKLVVRGRMTNLFQIFTSNLVEYIDCGDFVKVLKDAYSITICKSTTDNKADKVISKAKYIIPDNFKLILKQTIIDLENNAYGDIEFSKYTYNAFRLLDGGIKIILKECSIDLSKFKTYGEYFVLDKTKFIIKEKYKDNFDANQITALEDMYNYFYNQRHTLSHFGINIFGTIDDTRLINTKNAADEIVENVLEMIHKYL